MAPLASYIHLLFTFFDDQTFLSIFNVDLSYEDLDKLIDKNVVSDTMMALMMNYMQNIEKLLHMPGYDLFIQMIQFSNKDKKFKTMTES